MLHAPACVRIIIMKYILLQLHNVNMAQRIIGVEEQPAEYFSNFIIRIMN